MLDDIGAIEVDVFHERLAIRAIKNHMLRLARWPSALNHQPKRIGRTYRRVYNIWWNEERLSLAHEMIDDAVGFPDADFDVALQLIEKFFRIDLVKIVSRIRPLDDHDKEIAPIVQIAIAHRRFEKIAVLLDPAEEIDWCLNGRLRRRVILLQGFCRGAYGPKL
jgi:hypothetical protein